MGELADRLVIARLIEQFGPVVHLDRADAAGVARAAFRRAESRGLILRVAKAAFVDRQSYVAAGPWEQFRLRSMGFSLCSGPTTHLTEWAAAAMHGLPTFGVPPVKPVALRPGDAHTASTATPYGRVRTGHLPMGHRTKRAGLPTVGLAYTAVDVARHFGSIAGLLVADAVLFRGVEREVLGELTENMSRYPGMRIAQWAIEHADARCESPLETLGRLAFISAGRPVPQSNVWIMAGGSNFRVDHYLPEAGVVIEGDGALKYNNRDDADQIVVNQVERERQLRLLGLGFVRYNFALVLNRPRELVRRVDEEARLVRGGAKNVFWSFEPTFAGMKVARM